ncbi:phage portal protein [Pseudomonas sp. G.S.17]|uniref:phage portal protein n=1 Tax=Pseudomonas sp. G.S.17 TaxID=3137451 RepID=UPI00311C9AF5
MRLFGFELKRAVPAPVDSRNGGWFPIIREPYAGAWQKNDEWKAETVLAYHAVYACITLIAADVGKLRPRLVELDGGGIWSEITSPAFSPVLKKPNRYQNHIQFKQWWVMSKLSTGNTYLLKERDNRGVVVRLYILDPCQVTVLVTPSGDIYYRLNADDLNGIGSEGLTVPASEIIHDRMNCLFHPLVGISPLYACGLAASQGLKIQNDSAQFFGNGAKPGGILTAPGAISEDTAQRLKAHWEVGYTGENSGKVAVVGDGLKFEAMRMTAVDSQMIEQLRMTAEVVCSTFHVPPFKVGMGAIPAGQKVSDLNQIYYDDCLQSMIEEMEACLDEGLALPANYGVELDLDGLLRMDMGSLVETLKAAVGGCLMAPNEARRRLNLKPVAGGDSVFSQQQNFSLEALMKRDQDDPFSKPATPSSATQAATAAPEPAEKDIEDQARMLALFIEKELTIEHSRA